MRILPFVAAGVAALALAGCASLGQNVKVTSNVATSEPIIPNAIPGPPAPYSPFDLDHAIDIQKRVYSIDPDSPDFWYPR
jgi:hypothetical protein